MLIPFIFSCLGSRLGGKIRRTSLGAHLVYFCQLHFFDEFFFPFSFTFFLATMPIIQKWIKGPMWVHFLAPPVILFSSTCAGLAKSVCSSLKRTPIIGTLLLEHQMVIGPLPLDPK
ncbi:hypothetical protein AMTRI_Chr05g61250 [Amborella trichopoda]